MINQVFFMKCLLKPSYLLRKQLLLCFGVLSLITIILVVTAACLFASRARDVFYNHSDQLIQEQLIQRILYNDRSVADALSMHMQGLEGGVQILTEIVKDRIVGYPYEGWEDDLYVPFFDMETSTNKYPLQSTPLPLDWDYISNINASNAFEHLQEREYLMEKFPDRSSAHGIYFMQGACDPNEINPNGPKYYPNCTTANNDVTTGGVVYPTVTNKGLYEKSADIAILMKPLFESHKDVGSVGVYYANSGAGSYVVYPGDDRNSSAGPTLKSAGCDWMRTTNRYTGKPYGTEEEISRCSPAGTMLPQREYNVLERPWCQSLALNPLAVGWGGPYYSWDNQVPIAVVGRGIFDRMTGHFIGCSMFMITLEEFQKFLSHAKVNDDTVYSIVRFTDSSVFGDTLSTYPEPDRPAIKLNETDIISEKDFESLRDCVHASAPTGSNSNQSKHSDCYLFNQGLLYTANGVLWKQSSNDSDHENFRPDFLLIHKFHTNMLDVSETVHDQVDEEVLRIWVLSFVVGASGLAFVLLVIWLVARRLTQPLIWMERASGKIVNYKDNGDINLETIAKESEPMIPHRYTPNTELDDVVKEFNKLIHGFSGNGPSTIAKPYIYEIWNDLTWQSDYLQLYCAVGNKETKTEATLAEATSGIADTANDTAMDSTVSGNVETEKLTEVSQALAGNEESETEIALNNTASGTENETKKAKTVSCNVETEKFTTMARTREKIEIPGSRPPPLIPADAPASAENLKPVVPALPKCNFNKNILFTSQETDPQQYSEGRIVDDYKVNTLKSSLFWWLLVLIVFPLLLSIAGICIIVSKKSIETIQDLIDVVKNHSQDLESLTLHKIASLKAGEAARALETVVRDLYIVTRVAGWLLFNGVTRSDSFTIVDEITEECKIYQQYSCPVFDLMNGLACTCDHEYFTGTACSNYSLLEVRRLQERFFYVEARDFDPLTGNRDSVTLKMKDSPEQTVWWDNVTDMPGAEKGANASGFETTYDRVRVSSAMAVVEIPLYNYALEIMLTNHFDNTMIAFEADGMATGFSGCLKENALASQFVSTSDNRAAEINPELCPLGKYGYDPRCRDWYASGRNHFISEGLPILATAPYKLAVGQKYAASVTAPIANPFDNSYVGQMLLHFNPYSLQKLFKSVGEMSFLVVSDQYPAVNDTVESPYKDVPFNEGNILDLLFSHEGSNFTHRTSFQDKILSRMKSGKSGDSTFERLNAEGKIETFPVIYEPVNARVLLPLRPDDFSRGVSVTTIQLYSLGIAYQEESINEPWEAIADDVWGEIRRLRVIYFCIVVVVTIIFMLITFDIAVIITRPIVTLLRVVQTINGGKKDSGIPAMQGGSKEVLQVYISLTKLYKIIRGSNVAFFSGNLSWAYDFINDALKLFRKVGDEKAIGIACSNAGNTLHVILYDDLNPRKCGLMPDFDTALKTALEHYDEAVRIAEVQHQKASDVNVKANFKQQLSDRLFNRALLLFLAHKARYAPDEYKERSFRDIKRVRELDSEVVSFRLQNKLLLEKSAEHFFRLLQRCLGLLEYYEAMKEIWDPEEITRQADQFLYAAWNEASAPLFHELTRIGRLQQLESVVIQLQLRKGNIHDAARLAIRMFVEDEYLIEEALKSASLALLSLFRDPDECPYPLAPHTKASLESDLRRMLKSCRQISLDIGKCLIFAIEINEIWEGQDLLEKINRNCLRLFDRCCTDDDYIGVAAYTTEGDLNVPLGLKSLNAGRQRSIIDLATTSTSEMVCSSVPYATQMLIDSTAATVNDSFILLITDGYSWDASQGDVLLHQIEKLNLQRNTKIHVVILGLEIEEESVLVQFKKICAVSIISKYMDISAENVDNVFDSVRNIISGVDNDVRNHGIIMEKF